MHTGAQQLKHKQKKHRQHPKTKRRRCIYKCMTIAHFNIHFLSLLTSKTTSQ
jgi:hypothetical protein